MLNADRKYGSVDSQAKEDKDFGPDAGGVFERVHTKCFKSGKDYEYRGPSMVEGEGKVDEKLIADALGGVMFFDNVIDVL